MPVRASFPHVAVVERNAGKSYRMHGTAATYRPPDMGRLCKGCRCWRFKTDLINCQSCKYPAPKWLPYLLSLSNWNPVGLHLFM